jgi:hypothetical protein
LKGVWWYIEMSKSGIFFYMERVFEVAGEERRCLVAETYWKSIDKRYTKCLYLKNLLSIYEKYNYICHDIKT